MKGKCACLADFFLLQKKEGDYSRLIRENKIIGIACRVAASSNKVFKSQKQITRLAAPAKSRDNGLLPSWPHMFLYHVS
jgi:hypothetical protein